MTLTGVLVKRELGGRPTYVVEASEGPHELRGDVDEALVGERIRVTGTLAPQQFGFTMSGPILQVSRLERA